MHGRGPGAIGSRPLDSAVTLTIDLSPRCNNSCCAMSRSVPLSLSSKATNSSVERLAIFGRGRGRAAPSARCGKCVHDRCRHGGRFAVATPAESTRDARSRHGTYRRPRSCRPARRSHAPGGTTGRSNAKTQSSAPLRHEPRGTSRPRRPTARGEPDCGPARIRAPPHRGP